MNVDFLPALIAGGIFTVMWWLLRQKDAAQADQIKELFNKHDADAQKLAELENTLYRRYHDKEGIKDVLENLKLFFNERFDRVEEAIGVDRRRNNVDRNA